MFAYPKRLWVSCAQSMSCVIVVPAGITDVTYNHPVPLKTDSDVFIRETPKGISD